MAKVVLVGYSGHAFVAIDLLFMHNHEIVGYLDKSEKDFNPYNIKFLGTENDEGVLATYANEQVPYYCLGLGDNGLRRKVDSVLSKPTWKAISLVHPNAILSATAKVGEGTLVYAGAIINSLAEVGRGCIVNTGAIVEHECRLGDYVHVAPGAVLAGNVSVGTASFIGANATIKQGITIGNNVTIGAGAVVLRDIADNQTWVGNPAERIV